jgi:hypothetical protein
VSNDAYVQTALDQVDSLLAHGKNFYTPAERTALAQVSATVAVAQALQVLADVCQTDIAGQLAEIKNVVTILGVGGQ